MTQHLAVYPVAELRAMEQRATAKLGGNGYVLMTRAAQAAYELLRQRWPQARRIAIVCGGGNNGGDGYSLARLALAAGLEVRVLAVAPPNELRGEARQAYQDFCSAGGQAREFESQALRESELIVDALLGIGIRGEPRRAVAAAISAINDSDPEVFALDVPSGLDADTGEVPGVAIVADCTLSFLGAKAGLFLASGPAHAGQVRVHDLGVEAGGATPVFQRLEPALLAECLPPRRRDSHKGDFGHVLVVGGGAGMPGAARLCAEAALRVGAGLVSVACAPENVAAIVATRPELMCHGVADGAQLQDLLERADVLAIGPGLGMSEWSLQLLQAALLSGKSLVLDADALNLIGRDALSVPADSILTPHPGEAARLLRDAEVFAHSAAVQAARLDALGALCENTASVVVLKGAGTLIGSPRRVPSLCEFGNPGMAVAGMGDVLTGTIAGLLAQCPKPWLAARAGVLAHALAGDRLAARCGRRGLLALELAAELPAVLREHAP